jgi:hypothetical protein
MTIWNSTCNPCFSTFDQIFFVFHGLKTGFFCYTLKFNFICYPNRFFTYDYSLWDGGRHTSLRAKTNFILISSRHLFVHFVLPFSIKGLPWSPLLFWLPLRPLSEGSLIIVNKVKSRKQIGKISVPFCLC